MLNAYEKNSRIKCACGCGQMFFEFDHTGRPRKFMNGHNRPTSKEKTFQVKTKKGFFVRNVKAVSPVQAISLLIELYPKQWKTLKIK